MEPVRSVPGSRPGETEVPDGSAGLSRAEVRERAVRGSLLIAARGVALRAGGLLTSVVAARVLGVRDLGVLAIAAGLVAIGGLAVSGGLAAGLLRRPTEPSRLEYRAVLALQLALAVVSAALLCAAAAPFDDVAALTAVMTLSLPLTAMRTPAIVQLERRLEYRNLATAEVVEGGVYVALAVALLLAGAGTTGLAVAWVVRAAAGTATLLLLTPSGRMLPRSDYRLVLPHLRFGAQFQAVAVVNVARDQGLNVVIAAIGGLAVVGIWSLAYRVMQVPYLVFEALWRVSYPAMARLLALSEDAAPIVQRALSLGSAGTALVMVGLATSAPAFVPVVFGDKWAAAADVVIISSAALLVAGPLSIAGAGFLYASGAAASMVWVTAAHTLVWLCTTAALLPSSDARSVGWGWLAAAAVDVVLLTHLLKARLALRVVRACGPSWLIAVGVGALMLATPPTGLPLLLEGSARGVVAMVAVALALAAVRDPGLRALAALFRQHRHRGSTLA